VVVQDRDLDPTNEVLVFGCAIRALLGFLQNDATLELVLATRISFVLASDVDPVDDTNPRVLDSILSL